MNVLKDLQAIYRSYVLKFIGYQVTHQTEVSSE